MNSAHEQCPKSDSEQYTESKLSWVHQVHTLTQAARPGRVPCAQAGRVAPCRDRAPAVSQLVAGRVVAVSQAPLAVSLHARARC